MKPIWIVITITIYIITLGIIGGPILSHGQIYEKHLIASIVFCGIWLIALLSTLNTKNISFSYPIVFWLVMFVASLFILLLEYYITLQITLQITLHGYILVGYYLLIITLMPLCGIGAYFHMSRLSFGVYLVSISIFFLITTLLFYKRNKKRSINQKDWTVNSFCKFWFSDVVYR